MQLIPTKVEEFTVAFSFLGHCRLYSVTQLACIAQSLSGYGRTPGLDNQDYWLSSELMATSKYRNIRWP